MPSFRACAQWALTAVVAGASLIVPGRSAEAASTGTTSRVSVASGGAEATKGSGYAGGSPISADGRYVAFASTAWNLVADDTKTCGNPGNQQECWSNEDVFVRDRRLGTTRRVSVASDGTQLQGGGTSSEPAISADGRYVAFSSDARDLVPGDAYGTRDVFVHDNWTGVTERLTDNPANDVKLYASQPAISADGRYVAFTVGTYGVNESDVVIRDRQLNQTTAVGVNFAGGGDNPWSYDPSISADGRVVAFTARNNTTWDVFVRDLESGTAQRVGNGGSDYGSISPDGSHVVFRSGNPELVPGDSNGTADIFVRNLETGTTRLVSVASDGSQASGWSRTSRLGAISADNRYVTFTSDAHNLVPGDTNGGDDVFVHDLQTGTTVRASVASDGRQANPGHIDPALSADGRYVAFSSYAANLVSGDTNGQTDVFVRTLGLPTAGSVTPNRLVQGASNVAVEVNGSDFTPTPSLTFGPGISVNAVNFVSSNRLTANISLTADAPTGPKDVWITNPAGDSVVCTACFTVEARQTPAPPPPPPPPASPDPVLQPSGVQSGYWMITAAGEVHSFGDARHYGSEVATTLKRVDIEPAPNGNGYWILAESGAVYAKGAAQLHGSALNALRPGEKAAALSSTPQGSGYWIFTDRGRVLTFGAAQHFGDMSGVALNGPVLDAVATPAGDGYWMVASDGGVFTFGNAKFSGSTGNLKLNKPVMSMAPDPDGAGYWLVASDGGIFAFDAPFYGSMGATPLNKPISGIVPGGGGYMMVGEDGGIFAFGNVKFHGSLGANPPSSPVVAVALLS